jgi:hypothetical protein
MVHTKGAGGKMGEKCRKAFHTCVVDRGVGEVD